MHRRAAELLRRHRLVGHGLHHVRPGDEHVARAAHHEDEVRHRRRIDVAAGARAHDHRNLRDDAGRQHVALKHFRIAAERRDALLDARAARVVEADDRRPVAERHVLHLLDLLCVRLRQRAAEHGEILGEDEDRPPVDQPPAGDHPVARHLLLGHAELAGAVLDEHVELLEGAVVEQHVEPLARRELAARMLLRDALRAPALPRFLAPPLSSSACLALLPNLAPAFAKRSTNGVILGRAARAIRGPGDEAHSSLGPRSPLRSARG